MVRKLTNDYKTKLDNLSDREVVARFDLVMENFINLYKIYIINSINFGIDKGLNAWSVLNNYRKSEFGYTNSSKELYDISLNSNQLENKETSIISNLIYQYVINNYSYNINGGKFDISSEIFRYYKPFVFDYIKEYRPNLIQEINNILINKYKVTNKNSKVTNEIKVAKESKDNSKVLNNNKPKAV